LNSYYCRTTKKADAGLPPAAASRSSVLALL
jgi:hypothetical protein